MKSHEEIPHIPGWEERGANLPPETISAFEEIDSLLVSGWEYLGHAHMLKDGERVYQITLRRAGAGAPA